MSRGDETTLTVEQLTEMDPALRHLLTHEITTLGRWDVLRFFLETESEQGTMDEIGLAVGRDSEMLLTSLGALTTHGWLARRTQEGTTYYVLTQERERRDLLERLHTALHERRFRLQALYQWTRGQ